MPGKFSFEDKALYKTWRDRKLAAYPLIAGDLMTKITDIYPPKANEIDRILLTATQFNMAFYRTPEQQQPDKNYIHQLAKACGLTGINHNLYADTDSLSSIQASESKGKGGYIPYTNHRLSWHTDGYYNPPDEQINGMLLHCSRPALSGGTNWFMDHEIVYILLRETDPAYIRALQHPEALTIPANIQNGKIIRPEQSGPVFSTTAQGHLHMRYSARQRNIKWRNDQATRKATEFLLNLWEQNTPYKIGLRLQAGEGILCNNVLHCRNEFTDHEDHDKKRLFFRGRYTQKLRKVTKLPTKK